jgi:hypothetical protein
MALNQYMAVQTAKAHTLPNEPGKKGYIGYPPT